MLIKTVSAFFLNNNSWGEIFVDFSKTAENRKQWDIVLKILLIWIYWIEKQTKKLILQRPEAH